LIAAELAIFPGVKLRVVELKSMPTGTGADPPAGAVLLGAAAAGYAVIQEGSNNKKHETNATARTRRPTGLELDI